MFTEMHVLTSGKSVTPLNVESFHNLESNPAVSSSLNFRLSSSVQNTLSSQSFKQNLSVKPSVKGIALISLVIIRWKLNPLRVTNNLKLCTTKDMSSSSQKKHLQTLNLHVTLRISKYNAPGILPFLKICSTQKKLFQISRQMQTLVC